MYSVTERVEKIKQPRGGYLKTSLFVKESYNDGLILNKNENVNPSIVGLTVDYLTRYMSGMTPQEAFKISLEGARILDSFREAKEEEYQRAQNYVNKIDGLTDESIINACKLSGYDVCYRVSCEKYRSKGLEPDGYAISNIRNMVLRSITFFEKEGNIAKSCITFEDGYTGLISSGDADYLTPNGLWDMKVSKHEINAKYTLQLLVYYLMGMKSDMDKFSKVNKLGFFNPRKNISYWIDVSFIPDSVVSVVSREVIGYEI